MELKKALEVRNEIKKRKPFFFRQDAHKKKKLEKKWRKPKGLHSKMRLKFKGYRRCISKGYGSPQQAKGLDKNGLVPVLISNIEQLLKLDKNKESAVFAKAGKKMKIAVLKKAKELEIMIANIKDVDSEIGKIENFMMLKKEKKAKKKEEKKKKEKEIKEKKTESIEKKILSEEEERENKKKEKEKVLTKKSD